MKIIKNLILILLFTTVVLPPAQIKSMDKLAKLKPVITKFVRNNKTFFTLMGFYLFLKFMAYKNPNPVYDPGRLLLDPLSNSVGNHDLREIIGILMIAFSPDFETFSTRKNLIFKVILLIKFLYNVTKNADCEFNVISGNFNNINSIQSHINTPFGMAQDTALISASHHSNIEALKKIISFANVDLNRKNGMGDTALIRCARIANPINSANIAKELLFAGADPFIKNDEFDKTFYDYVNEIQNPEIKKQFEDVIQQYKEHLENLNKFGSKKLSNYIHDLNVTGLPKEVTSIIADYCVEVKDVDKKEYAAFVEQERKKLAAHLRTLQLPGFNNEVTNIIADYCM